MKETQNRFKDEEKFEQFVDLVKIVFERMQEEDSWPWKENLELEKSIKWKDV